VQNKRACQKNFLQNFENAVTFVQFPITTSVPMIELQPTTEHPLPFDLSDELPKTHKDGIAIAVNTSNLIDELGGSIEYGDADLHKAASLIQGTDKPNTPKHVPSAAEAKAASVLVKQFDFQAFADVQQARTYITNRLLKLSDCGDPKLELKALELLGKHSDIGLFTERSEITVHHTTSKGLEESIKERIKRLMNANVTDVVPLNDLDTHLGPTETTLPGDDTNESAA
jgi:hypothetical protein